MPLLDEPTNDLDVETRRALEDAFADFADRRRRLGDEADQPHRIKYKPLQR